MIKTVKDFLYDVVVVPIRAIIHHPFLTVMYMGISGLLGGGISLIWWYRDDIKDSIMNVFSKKGEDKAQ